MLQPSYALCRVDTHKRRHLFSRSYEAILPSSLTRVISRTFVFSTCLPVSVCGTGTILLARGFSRQRGIDKFVPAGTPTRLSDLIRRICHPDHPTTLNRHFQSPASLASCVPPSLVTLMVVQ